MFIGVKMDQEAITALMDGALLTDEEMTKYVAKWGEASDPEHPDLEALKKKQRTN